MTPDLWKVVGFSGQALFASRFMVQWVASERAKRSYVPLAFWYLSVAGGLVLFLYAVFGAQDIVFSIGQGCGLAVYVRNLILLKRNAEARGMATPPAP